MRAIPFGVSAVLAVGGGVCHAADDGPPLPYVDVGACPFECCVYRDWQAIADVQAYEEPRDAAAPAFRVATGEWVVAETGQVVTVRAGIKKVRRSAIIGYPAGPGADGSQRRLHVKAGDVLYSLHYLGEGYELFWYQGALYQDEIADYNDGSGREDPQRLTDEVSRADYVWWVRVRNRDGKLGWVRNPESFGNMDACG